MHWRTAVKLALQGTGDQLRFIFSSTHYKPNLLSNFYYAV